MTTQQQIFIQCRKMKFTWSGEDIVPVPVSAMAKRCECTEEEVIEAIKFFIDSIFDENYKEPFALELTSDYAGIIKKQSFNERMADDLWVKGYMRDHKDQGKFCYIFDKTYLTFRKYDRTI